MSISGPIFILGILGRSGTNFLSRLLDLHPDCNLVTDIPEDWLLAESHHLDAFTGAVARRWRSRSDWKVEPEMEQRLRQHLGRGLGQFLGEVAGGGRPVTKTPSVENIDRFFTLFPEAYLLILVRDGRDVVESAARSFGECPHQMARWWDWAAGKILDFDRSSQSGKKRYLILRYEDLLLDMAGEMKKVLGFLDLDPESYPFDRARDLPIFGSSDLRNEEGRWEWRITPGNGDLDPPKRWSGWSRWKHERFNRIAGGKLEAFGYEPQRYSRGRLFWYALTGLWAGADLIRRVLRRLTGRESRG